jgi:hypothetical protein
MAKIWEQSNAAVKNRPEVLSLRDGLERPLQPASSAGLGSSFYGETGGGHLGPGGGRR